MSREYEKALVRLGYLPGEPGAVDAIGSACCKSCAAGRDCESSCPDKIGAILQSDDSLFASRLNTAFQSLDADIRQVGWPDSLPGTEENGAFLRWVVTRDMWDAFFPDTQGIKANVIGLDAVVLNQFAQRFGARRAEFIQLTGLQPTLPPPVPPKPGENKPDINIGGGAGLGFGTAIAVGLVGVALILKK